MEPQTDGLADPMGHVPPEIRALVERVRRVVRDAAPDIDERMYKHGAGIGYHDTVAGCICGLFLGDDGVALMFPKAALLPDPDGLLAETDKKERYVWLRPDRPFPEEALARLFIAALIFGAR